MNGDLLAELNLLAANLGPAIAPASTEDLLRNVATAAEALYEAIACSIAVLDEAEEHLIFTVATGPYAAQVLGMRLPVERGVAGWALVSGQPVSVSDPSRDPRFAADVAERIGYVPRSIIAVPIEGTRRSLGVIEVLDSREGRAEGRRDLEVLTLLAAQAALAIETSQVFADLGRMLFAAAAAAAGGTELGAALGQLAQQAPGPSADLADLAECYRELTAMGPTERSAATQLIRDFLVYARARRPS